MHYIDFSDSYGDEWGGYTLPEYIEAIETVLNELEKKDTVIDLMAEEMTEWLGTCPLDKYDWQEIDCDKVCEDDMKECWKQYFYKKAEEK